MPTTTEYQANMAKERVLQNVSQYPDFPEIIRAGLGVDKNGYKVKIYLETEPNPTQIVPEKVFKVPIEVEIVGQELPF